jgi:hypothetical protein
MKGTFSFLALMILLGGCSASKSKSRALEISLGALSTSVFAGGLKLKIVNKISGEVTLKDISDSSYKLTLPNGTYDFFVVGFDGPAAFQGAHYCGSQVDQVFAGIDVSISINALETNCSSSSYATMIPAAPTTPTPPTTPSNPNNEWDTALWDSAPSTWGT